METVRDNIPELQEFSGILNSDIALPRKSRDNTVNKAGKELLRFCKTYGCFIINGRFGSDISNGDFTFINQNGCSVIDYFIMSSPLLNLIANFDIVTRPESCHLPVSMEFKSTCLYKSNKNSENVQCTYYDWNCANNAMYSENVYNHVLAGSFDELDYLIDNTKVDVNAVLNAFESVLRSCSVDLKRTKRRHHTTRNKSWFDAECKTAKLKLSVV